MPVECALAVSSRHLQDEREAPATSCHIGGAASADAPTVFPLIKVVSKLPLSCRNPSIRADGDKGET
jgi:hypothetical protein